MRTFQSPMTLEQIVAFLSAAGDDEVTVSVERLSRELYLVFKDYWEVSISADGQYGSIVCEGYAINLTGFDWRSRFCELRRILNDPRMVALIEEPAHS